MNYYFITGTSYGLGKAIAEQLLQRSNVHVYGVSRTCSIHHTNYTHVSVDLSDLNQLIHVTDLFKRTFLTEDNLYLINNAGIVDPIKHVSDFSSNEIHTLFNVNLLSVIELTNAFLKIPDSTIHTRIIVTISSGAASKVIDGWALYGASKAAIDHFSLHVAKELDIDNRQQTRIFSIAPGTVDTNMQRQIRETPINNFSTLPRFQELFETDRLVSPERVAEKYLKVIDTPADYISTIFSIRDI